MVVSFALSRCVASGLVTNILCELTCVYPDVDRIVNYRLVSATEDRVQV